MRCCFGEINVGVLILSPQPVDTKSLGSHSILIKNFTKRKALKNAMKSSLNKWTSAVMVAQCCSVDYTTYNHAKL